MNGKVAAAAASSLGSLMEPFSLSIIHLLKLDRDPTFVGFFFFRRVTLYRCNFPTVELINY